ncbi:circadian clock protein KaiC [Actinomadura vinacea]|uniref:non-specific serine/threonine protein kinase n=1 Tax=Actinomadura vinacea TaxID=115336 RepID=A0ABN3JER9_9ACTN
MTGTDSDPIERLATGMSSFDQVAMGGLPTGRSSLVTGTTGSGKTLFAVEYLARGIQRYDQHGVFVTFEETAADIRRNSRSLGFDIANWEADGKWIFVDASADTTQEGPTIGTYDFGALVARIDHAVRRVGASRVSLDSLGAIFTRFGDIGMVRHELFRMAGALETLGVTAVLTAERHAEYNSVSRYGVEEFVLDNVIILRNVLRGERRRRTVEIVKLRGAAHHTGEWLFTIDPREGMVIIPLAFLVPRERASRERVSTGNAALDRMVGGGVFRDAVTLISGPTGTGKTLTSLRFADAAYQAGERCVLYTFDETREQLARNATGWGMDLHAMESSGFARILADYPEVASLEDHFLRLHRAIQDFRPQRLIIDPLSALERIVTPRALLDFVIALGALLRQHEITTLLTSAPTGRVTPVATPAIAMEIASLADVTILLRYVERVGSVDRCIAVLQTRGSDHDQSVRQVSIDSAGMHIGAPLTTLAQIVPGSGYATEVQFIPEPPDESPK